MLKKFHNRLFGFTQLKTGILANTLFFLGYFGGILLGHYLVSFVIVHQPQLTLVQLMISKILVILIALHLSCILILRKNAVINFLSNYFCEAGSPFNLAIFRIIWFVALAGHFLSYCPNKYLAYSFLPDSDKIGLPLIGWLIHLLPVNPTLYLISCYTAGTICVFIMAGLFTRKMLIALLPFAFYALGVPMFYGKVSHYHILLWVPMLLCFSPCAEVLSLDYLLFYKKQNNHPSYHAKYFLPFKLLWLILATIYFFAGIIKLWDAGLNWAVGPNMINQMQWEWVENYDRVPNFRLDLYPILAKFAGLSTILFELLYFIFLLLPKQRWLAFVSGNLFHLACGYFMYIDFVNLRHAHLSYLNFSKFIEKIGHSTLVTQARENISEIKILINQPESRKTFFIGLTLIISTFVLSAFKIHSFPFSSFPTYSGSVPDKIEVLVVKPTTINGDTINIKQYAIQNKYRWESIRPLELTIINSFHENRKIEVNSLLNKYWSLLTHSLPNMPNVHKVEFSIQAFSIVPEKRNSIISEEYIGVIHQ